MSEKLKPCPLCGGEARVFSWDTPSGQFLQCRECSLTVGVGGWQSLPRRSEAAAEVARELVVEMESAPSGGVSQAQCRDWAERAGRLESIAEMGECERCQALETMIAQGGVTPGEKPRCARCTGVMVPTRPHPAIEHGWVMACPTCEDEPDLHPDHGAPESEGDRICPGCERQVLVLEWPYELCRLCYQRMRIHPKPVEVNPEGETCGESVPVRQGKTIPIRGEGLVFDGVDLKTCHIDPDCAQCDKPEQWAALHEELASQKRHGALLADSLAKQMTTHGETLAKAARYLKACKRMHREWGNQRDGNVRSFTPGMMAEYARLDEMWQRLVRERDSARAEVERLREGGQAHCVWRQKWRIPDVGNPGDKTPPRPTRRKGGVGNGARMIKKKTIWVVTCPDGTEVAHNSHMMLYNTCPMQGVADEVSIREMDYYESDEPDLSELIMSQKKGHA